MHGSSKVLLSVSVLLLSHSAEAKPHIPPPDIYSGFSTLATVVVPGSSEGVVGPTGGSTGYSATGTEYPAVPVLPTVEPPFPSTVPEGRRRRQDDPALPCEHGPLEPAWCLGKEVGSAGRREAHRGGPNGRGRRPHGTGFPGRPENATIPATASPTGSGVTRTPFFNPPSGVPTEIPSNEEDVYSIQTFVEAAESTATGLESSAFSALPVTSTATGSIEATATGLESSAVSALPVNSTATGSVEATATGSGTIVVPVTVNSTSTGSIEATATATGSGTIVVPVTVNSTSTGVIEATATGSGTIFTDYFPTPKTYPTESVSATSTPPVSTGVPEWSQDTPFTLENPNINTVT